MRKKLKKFSKNRQYSFTATVSIVYPRHILIHNVRSVEGEFLSDHMWLAASTRIRSKNLKEGDRIRFAAHIHTYDKNSNDQLMYQIDYGLSQIRNIKIISRKEKNHAENKSGSNKSTE